jgi:hypothetical protein
MRLNQDQVRGKTTFGVFLLSSNVDGAAGVLGIDDERRYLSFRYSRSNDSGSVFEASLDRGLSSLGATDKASLGRERPGSDVTFSEIAFSYVAKLEPVLGLNIKYEIRGSGSNDDLPGGQGFSVGRDILDGFGSAYDTAEFAGDWGVGVGVMASRDMLGSKFYALWDVARVGRNNPVASLGEEKTASGASLSIGVDWKSELYSYPIQATAEASKALTREVGEEGNRDARFFFTLCMGGCDYKVGI